MLRRLIGLWPEAILAAVTAWLVLVDGLRTSAGDPGYYWQIAGQVSGGMLPWRDFPFEYPPIALPHILLPYFLPGGGDLSVYLQGLFAENVILLVAIGLGVVWLARQGWSIESWLRSGLVYALLALALAPTVMWRFDALPTALTVAAVVAVAQRRAATSGVALGAAMLAKLYPVAMLPALFVGRMRYGRLRPALMLVLAGGAAMALIELPFVLIAGASAFSYLEYAIGRATQVESLPGALALLAKAVGGPSASIYHDFGTFQVDSPLLAILGPLWTLLTLALVGGLALALWWRYREDRARGGLRPDSQVISIVAALMVVLVTSKILSPQYLFWVVPFVALLSRPKTLVFWAACLLTTVGYPLNFGPMLNQDPLIILVINIRNAILVGFLVWVLAPDLMRAIRARGRLRVPSSPGSDSAAR